jgi:adenylate cyclase
VWGDAVNVAARMESSGVAGQIQVSEATHRRVESAFILEARGAIDIKGKGLMPTWLLVGRKPSTPMEQPARAAARLVS